MNAAPVASGPSPQAPPPPPERAPALTFEQTPEQPHELARELALAQRVLRLQAQCGQLRQRLRAAEAAQAEAARQLEAWLRARAGSAPVQRRHGLWCWGLRPTRPRVVLLPGATTAGAIAGLQRAAPHYLRGAQLARRRLLADRRRPEVQALLQAAGLAVSTAPQLYVARLSPARPPAPRAPDTRAPDPLVPDSPSPHSTPPHPTSL